jgi:branched-chain amino acid transport system substrate-binding protein
MPLWKKVLFLAMFLAAPIACGGWGRSVSAVYNVPRADEIYIGLAYPVELGDKDTYFRLGIDLAVNAINANGGVLGKTLNMAVRDDKNDTLVAMGIAEAFYNQGITAVIGHWSTNVCYFVEDTYEENEIVMLTPNATGVNIFEYDYQYIYRMTASNQIFAKTIAEYMEKDGLRRIAIYYSDDEYGNDFSAVLETELAKCGIDVIDRITGLTPANIKTVMNRWEAFGCDGVIMAALSPEIIEPIRLIHDADNRLPIFGADNFDRISFRETLGSYAGSLYRTSFWLDGLNSEFLAAFRTAYGHDPDIHSIEGYDSVYLLKDAIEAIETMDGAAIAKYLSELKDYRAVSGTLSYNTETQEFEGFNLAVQELKAR